jgi:hypothetical protein
MHSHLESGNELKDVIFDINDADKFQLFLLFSYFTLSNSQNKNEALSEKLYLYLKYTFSSTILTLSAQIHF